MADVTFKWYGDRVISDAERGMERGLTILANKIVQNVRKLMMQPKSGIDYRTAKQRKRQDRINDRKAQRAGMRASGQTTSRVIR